jgi:hypothetical protein
METAGESTPAGESVMGGAPALTGRGEPGGPPPAVEDTVPAAESHHPGIAHVIESPPARRPVERHTVYTARYRLTLRGPERGRWEFNLVAEADAPLVTVDAVVRGVRHRAGDASEPERLTAETVAGIAAGAAWTATR